MLLYNATKMKQSVQAFGNWLTFGPEQIKMVGDEIGKFIVLEKKQYGIVELPSEFEDPSYKESEEGKAMLAEKTAEGRSNRITHLKRLVHNEEVSLKQDLEKAGIKVNPNVFSGDTYLSALHELNEYKRAKEDDEKNRLAEIQRLKSALNKE